MPGAPTILCAGMAVLDQIFRVARFPAPHAKSQATAFMTVVGGCAANAAIAIARLGGEAELAAGLGGPAGEDDVGDRILAGLARDGVASSGIVRVVGATSTVSTILVDAAGSRTILSYCDERLFAATVDDPAALVAGVDAVLADNWLPDLVVPICAAARRRDIPVILDGDGPMSQRDRLVALASHLVFSAEGLRATTGSDDLGAGLLRLGEHTQAFLAVTDGANDILWRDGTGLRRLPVFGVEAVDTLAAGDIFHGAFALRLAEGAAAHDALRFAAAAAAIKCTRFGGGAGAPNRAEVEAFLALR
jgi:sugar/nucleoside kinase (ribokinase family)